MTPTRKGTSSECRFSTQLVDQRELLAWAPFGRTTLYSLQDKSDVAYDPLFPAPIKPMGRKNFWNLKDLEDWLESRIAAGRKPSSITTKRG